MTQIEEKSKADKGVFVKTWSGRVGHVLMEVSSLGLSLILVWLAILTLLMNRSSVDLNMAKPYYEQWFAKAFSGKTADIEHYTARWVEDNHTIELRADNIKIVGDDGVFQNIGEIRAEFALSENLLAKPTLKRIYVDGGAITLARDVNGRFQIGLGTPATHQHVAALWHSSGNQTTGKQTTGKQATGKQAGDNQAENATANMLDRVVVANAHVYVQDDLDGLALSFEDVSGVYGFENGKISVKSDGKLVSGLRRVPYVLKLQTVPDLSSIFTTLKIEGVNPAEIASERGRFAKLSNLNAPVTLDVALKTVAGTGLEDLQIRIDVGEGHLKTGTTYKPFTHARVRMSYDVPNQSITLNALDIASEAINVVADGVFENVGDVNASFSNTPLAFDLNIDRLRINPGVRFSGPITLSPSEIKGAYNFKDKTFVLEKGRFDFGDFTVNANASTQRNENGDLVEIHIEANVEGIIEPSHVLHYWPRDFVLGARNWFKRSAVAGEFSAVDFVMNLNANDIATGVIANDHFTLSFETKNVELQYISTMPLLFEDNGFGILHGNSFEYHMKGGKVAGLTMSKGTVLIPQLNPKGSDFTIDLYGNGQVKEMLRISDLEPFSFAKQQGINPADFGGNGAIHLKITRPLLENYPQERVSFALDGDFTDVEIPSGIGRFTFNGGNLSIDLDKKRAVVKGPIKIGKWQSELFWQKQLEPQSSYAVYTITGTLNRDDLDGFGIGLRRHFGGEIDVRIEGVDSGIGLQAAELVADFTNADVNLGDLWHKPAGEFGSLTGLITFNEQVGGRFDNVIIKAPDLALAGSVSLAANYKLLKLDLTQAYIKGFIDASLEGKPTADGVLNLNMAGEYFNISSWVDKAFQTQSSAISAPMFLTASLKKMSLDENYHLMDARALFSHTGEKVDRAKLTGLVDGGNFLAEISGQSRPKVDGIDEMVGGLDTAGNVHVKIPNAARAAKVFLGINSIRGGVLEINGYLPPDGSEGGVRGFVSLKDFTLVRAPAFAQILSLASLQGLAGTLSGTGMKFSTLDMDFAIDDGVLKIRDGRASGAALGLTGEGDIGIANKTLDFNGVLVPAYAVNSILGDIPLLGDIIVGKKGEGMFALNYAVKGPFAKTRVSVNPLSALTPGFLRRIFDVKRDKVTDPKINDLIKEQRKKKE
ncbi:MAG: hypothetical protein COA43_01995 [Robiginitomaculum sp.]|nr:MAG: hypothetical protein COA43_01995 [Robiginitomaculum sp.]